MRHVLAMTGLLLGLTHVVSPGVAADLRDRPAEIAALVAAYPDFLASSDATDIIFKDGTRMAIDDGAGVKEFDTLLDHPDIEDQFYAPYSLGAAGFPPGIDSDPGRVRYEPLFRKMYGDCRKGGVSPDLVNVAWIAKHNGGSVQFTSVNGAAAALARVSEDLDKLPAALVKYLKPSAGTFNCRVIAGTERLSMHAYGAAIDINTKFTDYWRWSKVSADGSYPYKNRIPIEIVDVFERHGFIWGGKWYHYDTMHFEYRPDLIALARARKK